VEIFDFIDLDVGQRTDTVVFMVIAIGAAVLLLVMLLIGEAFEFMGDSFDVDDGAGIFNMQSIAAFLAGFGAIAWLLSGYFDVSSLLSALGGILGGIPMAGSVVLLTRTFMKQAATTSFHLTDLVGETARVTLRITERGVGRIQYERAGGTHTATARSVNNKLIEVGSIVQIESVLAGECLVREVE